MPIEIQGGDYEHTLGITALECTYRRVNPAQLSKLILGGGEFDVAEYSLANHIMLRAQGEARLIAIPVFPSRAFRNAAVFVTRDSALRRFEDLAGKRVGISEFAMTTAVWTRGQIADACGLDWGAVKWTVGAAQRFTPPAGYDICRSDQDLEQLLIDGALDALMAGRPKDSQRPRAQRRLRCLVQDPAALERDYLASSGLYPIMHTVVLHTRVQGIEGLARRVFEAYCEAKRAASQRRLSAAFLPGVERLWDAAQAEAFESVRYGLTARNRTNIDTMGRYLQQQGFIAQAPALDTMFVSGADAWIDQ